LSQKADFYESLEEGKHMAHTLHDAIVDEMKKAVDGKYVDLLLLPFLKSLGNIFLRSDLCDLETDHLFSICKRLLEMVDLMIMNDEVEVSNYLDSLEEEVRIKYFTERIVLTFHSCDSVAIATDDKTVTLVENKGHAFREDTLFGVDSLGNLVRISLLDVEYIV